MTSFATTTQLATYLCIDEADLPTDAKRLLARATDDINYIILNNSTTDLDEELANACCAQVEWWIETGDELGLSSIIESMDLGEFSVSYGTTGASTAKGVYGPIAQRAYQFLFRAGLLWRGIRST